MAAGPWLRNAPRTRQFVRFLRAGLRHRDPRVRYACACLTSFRDGLGRALARRAADPREHPVVRGVCLECLSQIGSKRAVRSAERAVLAALRDPDGNVRFWACYAAAQLEMRCAVPILSGMRGDAALGTMGWTVGYEAGEAVKKLTGCDGWDDDRLPGEHPYPRLWDGELG